MPACSWVPHPLASHFSALATLECDQPLAIPFQHGAQCTAGRVRCRFLDNAIRHSSQHLSPVFFGPCSTTLTHSHPAALRALTAGPVQAPCPVRGHIPVCEPVSEVLLARASAVATPACRTWGQYHLKDGNWEWKRSTLWNN